jgi:dipeptidyl-peptidase-4
MMGLRNRMAILAEAYSNEIFEKRILASKIFVLSVLEYANAHAKEMVDLVQKSGEATINEIRTRAGNFQKGVQFKMVPVSDKPVELLKRETAVDSASGRGRPWSTGRILIAPNIVNYNKFEPSKLGTVPRGYVFPAELKNVADKLKEHGVRVAVLDKAVKYAGEEFVIESFKQGRESYPGHPALTMAGAFKPAEREFAAGSYVVDLAQPLAYLAFYLLEPESDDGLMIWNFFDAYLKGKGVEQGNVPFPVFKYFQEPVRESGLVSDRSQGQSPVSPLNPWSPKRVSSSGTLVTVPPVQF